MSRIQRIRGKRRQRAIIGWTIVVVNVGFVVLNLAIGNVSHLTAISAASAISTVLIITA